MNIKLKYVIIPFILISILLCFLFVPIYSTSAETYCTETNPPIRKSVLLGDTKQSINSEISSLGEKAANNPSSSLKNCVSSDQKYKLYVL